VYLKSSEFYDALYHFVDYEGAAKTLTQWIHTEMHDAGTLLDVACGTGRHLEHLQGTFAVEGLDLNAALLEQAKRRCPGVPLHCGNMLDFSLGKTFDVVACLFSSIAYVRTRENMERAVLTMARHVRPGGLLIVEPWFTPDSFWVGHVVSNHVDTDDLKITWSYVSERDGDVSVLDIHYLVASRSGVEHFAERHELGLFTRADYAAALERAGFDVSYDPGGLHRRGMWIGKCRRPASAYRYT
jgi:SAM-dependent methyltransferase